MKIVSAMRGAIVATLTILSAPLLAQDNEFAAFGEYLEEFRVANNTPAISALIIENREVVWEAYLGTSDDEGDFATTADTTYYIASVTKPIAATAILAESLEGAIDLNAPMSADPAWERFCERFRTTPIPFMSGGEDMFGNEISPVDCEKPTTLGEMLDMRANGDAFVYNPIAFARIDRVIRGSGGRDLRTIVRERVQVPAAMQDVGLGWRDPDAGSALRWLAMPHHVREGRIAKQPYPDDDFRAAAGIIANPLAIAAFDIAYDDGLIVPLDYRAQVVRGEAIGPLGDYRMGWWLEEYNGQRLIWHSGKDDEKYSALYLKMPEQEMTLIVLANTEAIWSEGSSVVEARVSQSPVARRFLELFAQ